MFFEIDVVVSFMAYTNAFNKIILKNHKNTLKSYIATIIFLCICFIICISLHTEILKTPNFYACFIYLSMISMYLSLYMNMKDRIKRLNKYNSILFVISIPETYEFTHCVGVEESFNICPKNIDMEKIKKNIQYLKS